MNEARMTDQGTSLKSTIQKLQQQLKMNSSISVFMVPATPPAAKMTSHHRKKVVQVAQEKTALIKGASSTTEPDKKEKISVNTDLSSKTSNGKSEVKSVLPAATPQKKARKMSKKKVIQVQGCDTQESPTLKDTQNSCIQPLLHPQQHRKGSNKNNAHSCNGATYSDVNSVANTTGDTPCLDGAQTASQLITTTAASADDKLPEHHTIRTKRHLDETDAGCHSRRKSSSKPCDIRMTDSSKATHAGQVQNNMDHPQLPSLVSSQVVSRVKKLTGMEVTGGQAYHSSNAGAESQATTAPPENVLTLSMQQKGNPSPGVTLTHKAQRKTKCIKIYISELSASVERSFLTVLNELATLYKCEIRHDDDEEACHQQPASASQSCPKTNNPQFSWKAEGLQSPFMISQSVQLIRKIPQTSQSQEPQLPHHFPQLA